MRIFISDTGFSATRRIWLESRKTKFLSSFTISRLSRRWRQSPKLAAICSDCCRFVYLLTTALGLRRERRRGKRREEEEDYNKSGYTIVAGDSLNWRLVSTYRLSSSFSSSVLIPCFWRRWLSRWMRRCCCSRSFPSSCLCKRKFQRGLTNWINSRHLHGELGKSEIILSQRYHLV